MPARKFSVLNLFSGLLGLFVVLAAFGFPSTVYADEPIPTPDQGTCVNCHENLYFLHDTGKWFCLKAAPMACVDCHGGDPTATTQAAAHAHRAAYPIVNDDVTKCQECHPAQSNDRVEKFDRVAKISNVIVAQPYQPRLASPPIQPEPKSPWDWMMKVLAPILVIGFALAIYLMRITHLS